MAIHTSSFFLLIAVANAFMDKRSRNLFFRYQYAVMDGWEFLNEYNKLKGIDTHPKMIMMLTTSLNPDDRKRAEENSRINDFLTKPLTEESLKSIIQKHFKDYL